LIGEPFHHSQKSYLPLKIVPAAGFIIDFDTMEKSWFKAMGWDITAGKPGKKILSDPGLDELVNV
jgi:hypothetical protein